MNFNYLQTVLISTLNVAQAVLIVGFYIRKIRKNQNTLKIKDKIILIISILLFLTWFLYALSSDNVLVN